MPSLLILALAAWQAGGQPSPTPSPSPRPALPLSLRLEPASQLGDIASLERALASPVDGLEQAQGEAPPRTPATCAELGGDLPAPPVAANPIDQRPLLSERVHCRALLWLQKAGPARASHLGSLPLTAAGIGALPAALMFRGAGPRRASATGPAQSTWRRADPGLRLVPARRALVPGAPVRLRGRGYQADLSLYARGDFDGDGLEDALFRRDASPAGGSYREFAIFLVTRRGASAPLVVTRQFAEGY